MTKALNLKASIIALFFVCIVGCQSSNSPQTIDLSRNWRFSPDENNIGISENWYAINIDDSQWTMLDAGKKWEEQGYPDLDSYGWYRKTVDPPADFEITEPYLIFDLDQDCKKQQMGEGWFRTIDDVPQKAISISIKQIMKSKNIICSVPDSRKA